jgi:hypothetical protein
LLIGRYIRPAAMLLRALNLTVQPEKLVQHEARYFTTLKYVEDLISV